MSMSETSSEPVVKQRPRGRPGPREFEMYRLRVDEGLTLEAIGERFHISKERVRQLLNINFHMPKTSSGTDSSTEGV